MVQVSAAPPAVTRADMIADFDIQEDIAPGSTSGSNSSRNKSRSGRTSKGKSSSNLTCTEIVQEKDRKKEKESKVLPVSRQIWDGGVLQKIPFHTPIKGYSSPQHRYLRLRRIDDNDVDYSGSSGCSDYSDDDDDDGSDDENDKEDIASPLYAFRTPSPHAKPKKTRRKAPITGTTTPNSGIGRINANKYNSVEVSVTSRTGAGNTGRLLGHEKSGRTIKLASNPLCLEWFEQPNTNTANGGATVTTARSPYIHPVSARKVAFLQDITEIQSGHGTPAFAAYGMKNGVRSLPDASLCFSIVGKNRTLDFAAASVHEATRWKTALVELLDEYRNWGGIDSSTGIDGRKPQQGNRRGQFTSPVSRLTSPDSSVGSPNTTGYVEWDQAKNYKVFAAAKSGNIKSLQKYFYCGCPVDTMEQKSGDTPLLLACRLGHVAVVDLTLQLGARNDPHPTFGQTALQAAVSAGHAVCVRLLLETAAQSGADAIIANHEEICSDGIRREAPIHVASRCGSLSIVQLLVLHGANLALVDSSGRTCLHCCTQSGHTACLKYLLDAGGDAYVEKRNDLGHTILHLAIQNNRLECLRCLVDIAVDVNAFDNFGTSALDMARSRKLRKITTLLLDYGAIDEDDGDDAMSAVTYDDMHPRSSRTTIWHRPQVVSKRYTGGSTRRHGTSLTSQSDRFEDSRAHAAPVGSRSTVPETCSSYSVSDAAPTLHDNRPATDLPAPIPDHRGAMPPQRSQAPSFPHLSYGHDTMPSRPISCANNPYGELGLSHVPPYEATQQHTNTAQEPHRNLPPPPTVVEQFNLASERWESYRDPCSARVYYLRVSDQHCTWVDPRYGTSSEPSPVPTKPASTNINNDSACGIEQQATAGGPSPLKEPFSLRAPDIESGEKEDTSAKVTACDARIVDAMDERGGGNTNGKGMDVAAEDGDSGRFHKKKNAAAEGEAEADPRRTMLDMIRSRAGQAKSSSDINASTENEDANRPRRAMLDMIRARGGNATGPLNDGTDERGVHNGNGGGVETDADPDPRSAILAMIRARADELLATETEQTKLPNPNATPSNSSIDSTPKPASTLSDDTQKAISKYKKMLSMRVPGEAVKHAMKKDGNNDPTTIAAVFDRGSSGNDPPDEQPEQCFHQPAPRNDAASKPTKADIAKDQALKKYVTMCRVGVPVLSAMHKMTQDNVAQEKIVLFKLAYGIPVEDDTSASKKLRPPPSSKRPNTAVMQKIHWTAVTEDDKLQDSVWTLSADPKDETLDDSDLLELESVFAAKPIIANQIVPSAPIKNAKKQNITIIDPKRAYNVAISLAQFRDFESFDALASAVVAQDCSRLNAEKLQNMTTLLPTADEVAIIKRHGDNADGLGRAELFFLAVSRVPRFASKLTGFLYSVTFSIQTDELRHSISILSSACTQVVSSNQLGLMLRRILAVGNALNESAGRPKARGITLASLLKTATKKGNDNKTTVVDYAVASVMKQGDPDGIVDFMSSIPSVKDAKRIDPKDLRATFRGLEGGLTQIRNVLSAEEATNEGIRDDDATAAFISKSSRFVVEAEAKIKSIASMLDEAEKSVESLCKFFAEDPLISEASSILGTLIEFSLLVKNAKESWERRKRAAKRKTPVRPKTAPGGAARCAAIASSAHPSNRSALLSAIKGRKKPTPPVIRPSTSSAGRPPPDRAALLLAIANSRRQP